MSNLFKAIGEIENSISKEEIVRLGQGHANVIIESDQFELVKSYATLKRYELYLKTMIDELKTETAKKITASGQKDFEFGTSTVVVNQRRKFDFSNDTHWNELAKQTKNVSDQKKTLEAVLKEMTEGEIKEFVNKDTGEMRMVHGPKVEFSETLMVKIA